MIARPRLPLEWELHPTQICLNALPKCAALTFDTTHCIIDRRCDQIFEHVFIVSSSDGYGTR